MQPPEVPTVPFCEQIARFTGENGRINFREDRFASGEVRLTISGELDSIYAYPFYAWSDETIWGYRGREACSNLIIDISNVEYIDPPGLGFIVRVTAHARARGGDAHIVCTNPRILRIFEMTGLDKALTLNNPSSTELTEPEA